MPEGGHTPVIICDGSTLVYSGESPESESVLVSYAVPRGFDVEQGVTMNGFAALATARKLVRVEVQGFSKDHGWRHVGMLELKSPQWKPEWKRARGHRKARPEKSRHTVTVEREVLRAVQFELGSTPLRVSKLTVDGGKSVPLHFGHSAVLIARGPVEGFRPEECFPKHPLPVVRAGSEESVDLSSLLMKPKKHRKPGRPVGRGAK